MSIVSLKGEDLDTYLSEQRSAAIRLLEEYYEEERRVEQIIKKIRTSPCHCHVLMKTPRDRIIIYGNTKDEILRLILKEGYKVVSSSKN